MIKAFRYYIDILNRIKNNKDPMIKSIRAVGGRKSAKTLSSYEFVILACAIGEPNKIACHCFRNIKKDIEEVRKDITLCCVSLKIPYEFSASRNAFIINGNTITLRGLRNRSKEAIVGLGLSRDFDKTYSIRVYDEAYEYSKEDIGLIQSGLGGSTYVIDIYNSNPWLETQWFIADCNRVFEFNDEQMKLNGEQFNIVDNNIYHYTNHTINELLAPSDKEQLANVLQYDPIRARVEYYGLPGIISDSIYAYYMSKIKKYIPNGIVHYVMGIDYGEAKSATCVTLIGITMNEEIVHLDEWYYCNNDNDVRYDMLSFVKQIVMTIKKWIKEYNLNAIGEEIGIAIEHAAAGLYPLIYQELGMIRFFDIRKCTKWEELKRIKIRKYYMAKEKYYVSTKCVQHYRELQNQVWEPNKPELKPLDANNHITDACDYAITLALTKGWLSLDLKDLGY